MLAPLLHVVYAVHATGRSVTPYGTVTIPVSALDIWMHGNGGIMATVEECRAALQKLAARLAENAAATREKLDFDRSLACRVTDLDVAFHGRLQGGQISGLTDGDDPRAKI